MPTPVLDAELQVARHRVLCTTTRQGLRQKTDFAGRRSTRVRSHPIEVIITGEAACWSIWDELAADSVRRESGHLVWRTAQGQVVRHLVFYDAYCTRLGFRFDARGQQGQPSLELTLRFSPAAIELNGHYVEFYSRLPWEKDPRVRRRALVQPPPLLPPHLPPLPPRTIPPAAAAAAAEEAAGLLGGAALRAASTVLGTLALVLTPANDADAPGYDAEKSFQKNHPPNLDAIRLAELEREREYRALTTAEEAEYVALLAKVKGIRSPPDELEITIKPEDQIDRDLLNPPTRYGNAPTFKKDGTKVEIHHEGQQRDGPFREMHWQDHRGKGKDKLNHPNKGEPSQVNRTEFNIAKKKYWKKQFPNAPKD